MNTDWLRSDFERLIEAENSVCHLRGLILDLAIRGKLDVQRSSDGHGADLLKEISAQRASMPVSRRGNKRSSSGELAVGRPFSIPSSWAWTTLSDIGVINPRNNAADDVSASFVPMPLIPAEYGRKSTHQPRLWGSVKNGYTHFAEGDVGLAKITPCFENGKSTVFRELTGGIGAGTTELHVVRPLLVDPDFILIILKSRYFIETGVPLMTGTAGQKRVPAEYFKYAPVPLPPLLEQHRIVSKVNELMALCGELETAREQREQRRKQLLASSLTCVITPPETSSIAAEKDVSFFLSHFGRMVTRSAHVADVRRTILSLAIQGRLVPVTGCWKEKRLRQLISFGPRNGLSPRESKDPHAPKCLTLTATTSGVFNSTFFKRVDASIPSDSHLWLRKGDILFQRGNTLDYVGTAALFDGADDEFIYPDLMIKVRANPDVDARWIVLAANSPFGREYMAANAAGAQKTMPKINHGTLLNFPVPVPPLADQIAVLDRVSELLGVCDELERSLAAVEEGRARALGAVLQRVLDDAGALLPALAEAAG